MGQAYFLSRLKEQIDNGDLEKVKITLPNLDNINSINIDEHSLIAYTAARGHYNIIQYLINKEVDVNRVGPNKKHALISSLENNYIKVVKLLVEHSANSNYIDAGGETPLIIAVKRDNEEIAKFLLEKGANVTKAGNNGKMPLSYAVDNKNEKMMKLLLDNGAHYTIHTAFLHAISRRDLHIVKYLHQNRAQLNLNQSIDGYTPLTKAVEVEHFEIVRFLVQNGADVNKMDAHKSTPLSVAALKQDIRIFDYLIEKGASKDKAIAEIEKVENLNTDFKLYLDKLKTKCRGLSKNGMQNKLHQLNFNYFRYKLAVARFFDTRPLFSARVSCRMLEERLSA